MKMFVFAFVIVATLVLALPGVETTQVTQAGAPDMESYFEMPNPDVTDPCAFNLTSIRPSLAAIGCETNLSAPDAKQEVELAMCAAEYSESHPATFGGTLKFVGIAPVGADRPSCFD